jgi:membrane protease YdiL (CAAX protease family)
MKNRETVLFILFAFGLSWLIALVFYFSGGRWNTGPAYMVAIAYMIMPLVAAMIVNHFFLHRKVTDDLGIYFRFNKWLWGGWLLIPILMLATIPVSLMWSGVEFTTGFEGIINRQSDQLSEEQVQLMRTSFETLPVHPVFLMLLQALAFGISVNAVAAFGEEAGWRGFLLARMKNYTFLKASLLNGTIWGIWHFPIILMGHNYPEHPVAGLLMMVLFTILITPMHIYIRLKAGSVIAASVLHGTLNGAYGLSLVFLLGGNDLQVGLTGAAGLFTMVIFNLLLFLFDRHLTSEPVWSGTIGNHLKDQPTS